MKDIGLEIQSKFESEGQKAMLNVKFTANYFNQLLNKQFSDFNISSAQYNILRILRGAKGEPLSVQMVKERMVEKSPNTTRLLDKLCAKNLVERQKGSADKRSIFLEITKDGLDLLQEIKLNDLDLYKRLSDEEYEQLNHLLNKMRS